MDSRSPRSLVFVSSLLLLLLGSRASWAQVGIVLAGAGAINKGMGGASTGAPLNAGGALYWNPSTMSALPSSEMDFSLEFAGVQTRLSSGVPAGLLGPDPVGGSDAGENGVFYLPTFAFVYKLADPDWAVGLGILTVGGYGVNYQDSTTNVILKTHPIFTQLQVLQVAPAISYQITDQLSVGVQPVLDLANLDADPGAIVPVNPDGSFTALTHTRYRFGGGVHGGVYYHPTDDWGFGFSVKSPQWFEPFRWHSADNTGLPRNDKVHLEFPMIFSVGASYTGFERWVLAADLRYVDYAEALGFGDSGFDSAGALRGVGWNSIFALSLGVQYCVTDCLAIRIGYSWNENPIPNDESMANVGSPSIAQNTIYIGGSYHVSDALVVSAAYDHVFANSIEGPITLPSGRIPGTFVKNQLSIDGLTLGLSVLFGGPTK
jgi:long-chain fatty acid transport protein